MAYDLRDFIDALKNAGELEEIDQETDWNFEIPAYDVLSGRFGGPALLFNNVKGCEGYRVLVRHIAGSFRKPHSRIAVAFGLPAGLTRTEWFENAGPAMSNMLRPVEVATGSCQEVVKMGKDVNLLEYPFTYHAIGDGGKYILMNATTIKDPDSEWTNIGNYAAEVYSRNRLVITAYAHTNFMSIYLNKYQGRGNAMPVAISLGGDPAVSICAGTIMPPGMSEYDAAGGLRGAPIELVKCQTSDILVPANSEMVIEGEIRPYERLPEGPKIECFGFSVGPRQLFFAMRVHCITHRKNPIFPDLHAADGCACGAIHESVFPIGLLASAKMLNLPLKLVNASPVKSGVTSSYGVKKQKYPEDYPGFTTDLWDKILAFPGLGGLFSNQFMMDDDVNLLEYSDMIEAMFTQTHPARDLEITEAAFPTMTVDSSALEPEELAKYYRDGTVLARKKVLDGTTKEEPPMGVRRTQFETLYPETLQKWVVENWERLGFTEEARWNDDYLKASF